MTTAANEVRRLKYAVEGCFNGVWGDDANGVDDLAVARVADFNRERGYVEFGDAPTVRAIPHSARNRRLLAKGDLLIEKSGGGEQMPVGNVVLFDDDRPSVCSNFVARMPVVPECDSRFVSYVFRSLYSEGKNVTHIKQTSGIQNLDSESYLNEKAWLPDRRVQTRIAKFLDDKTARIDTLIAEKERLVKSLNEYQYSYSSKLMTLGMDDTVQMSPSSHPEIGTVPSHWLVTPLKFLGEVRSGVAKGKDHGDSDTVSLPYLRVANVQSGFLDLTEVLNIEVSKSDANRYLLRKGDVLMNEGGDNDKLGRGAVWQGQIEPCIHQNHVFAVRLYDLELADWVSAFTSTDAARTYFYLRSKQSTNLASINQSNVRELPVPMPPESERKAIMAELKRSARAINDLIEHAEVHIASLREYRSSLISAAVTGQLDIASMKEVA